MIVTGKKVGSSRETNPQHEHYGAVASLHCSLVCLNYYNNFSDLLVQYFFISYRTSTVNKRKEQPTCKGSSHHHLLNWPAVPSKTRCNKHKVKSSKTMAQHIPTFPHVMNLIYKTQCIPMKYIILPQLNPMLSASSTWQNSRVHFQIGVIMRPSCSTRSRHIWTPPWKQNISMESMTYPSLRFDHFKSLEFMLPHEVQ